MNSDSNTQQQHNPLHFVLCPFMAQGHMIPMVNIAKLLAQRGVVITILTTPSYAARHERVIARAVDSGLQIRMFQIEFPSAEAGLPEGCDSLDMLHEQNIAHLVMTFFKAVHLLEQPYQKQIEELKLKPNCIIADMCLPFTNRIANKLGIPKIVFHGFSCFCLLCYYNIHISKITESITSDYEYFVVPDLPDRVELTKNQLAMCNNKEDWKAVTEQMGMGDLGSYGVIINTFEQLEPAYVNKYKKARDGKIWCIGPVSVIDEGGLDAVERGNKASIDESQCLKWLDSQKPSSVLYVCLGSICNLPPALLIELGLGLEASNKPFIWVIREGHRFNELEEWIQENEFEKRTKARGLLIKGWAPQLLILSHPAIAGFLTHCGWNSTLEGISAGVPLITWPLFGDQFCNEKLAVQILRVGLSVGVKQPMMWGEEDTNGVLVKKEDIQNAIGRLMDEGEEKEDFRKRARELGEMAKNAVGKEGSSYLNISLLIQDIMQQQTGNQKKFI